MVKRSVLGLLVMAAFARESLAQDLPSASQLEQERARIEQERKQMFDPANPATQPKRGALPAADAIEREMRRIEPERKQMFDAENPATKNAPNVFPNIPTPAPSGIDIEALARQYERKAQARKRDDLMVFASFTMPAESLQRLVRQANRVGATVVFNGFKDNSMKATAAAINALGEAGGNVIVNPNAFAKYQIAAVPTVVLATPAAFEQVDENGCALPDHYAAIAGDVSLDYALDELARRAPQFEPVATRYVRQLRGR